MGRIVVSEFVSVDGVMEAPGGEPGHPHTGWVGRVPDGGQFEYKFGEARDAAAQLLGRVTYESFAGAWPRRTGPFADRMNAMPKHVVSSSPHALEWENSHLVAGEPIRAARDLRERTAGDLLVAGSRTLVHALMRADLVDELRLMVFPVVLGSGFRVFPDSPEAMPLALAGVRTFDCGVALMTYRRDRTGLPAAALDIEEIIEERRDWAGSRPARRRPAARSTVREPPLDARGCVVVGRPSTGAVRRATSTVGGEAGGHGVPVTPTGAGATLGSRACATT